MRSSVPTLETYFLKIGGVDDEPEDEPDEQQQQIILNEINKKVVETPLKNKDKIINEYYLSILRLQFALARAAAR